MYGTTKLEISQRLDWKSQMLCVKALQKKLTPAASKKSWKPFFLSFFIHFWLFISFYFLGPYLFPKIKKSYTKNSWRHVSCGFRFNHIYFWVKKNQCNFSKVWLSHLFLKFFFQKLKKLLIVFQFSRIFFSKNENYCVSLEHTLVKFF